MNNNSNFLLSNTVQIVKGLLKNSQNSSFGDSPSLKKDEGQMNSIVQPGDKMHSIENTSIRKTISLNLETKEEFEQKKRQLLILLDQAVSMKLKISRAFPEKLKTFGDINRFGLNWHSGWRDPEEYIPPLDCDPFIGACSEVSCICDGFVTWEHEGGIYVYNPRLVNPETELCSNCHHSKKSHHLRSKTLQFPEDRRRMLKEYSSEILEKYGIPEGTMQQDEGSTLGNRRHPSEVPQYELQRFYDQHPDFPGASERLKGFSLSETISDDQQVGSGASNKKKSSVMGMMMDDVDDGFGDGFGEDDDLL